MTRNLMIDIETTGLNPFVHEITSIGCVGFDYDLATKRIEYSGFHHYRLPYPMLNLSPETMAFRKLHHIDDMEKQINGFSTYDDFFRWFADLISQYIYIWSKPITFDMTFIAKLHHDYNKPLPWGHRQLRDTYTHIEAATGYDANEFIKQVPNKGIEHLAVDDALHQAQCVILASKVRNGESVPVFTP